MKTEPYAIKEIAAMFSTGNFEPALPYLSENIVWKNIGEKVISGKQAVISNCIQISKYFNSVETDFITKDIILENNKVVVIGTAEFKEDGKRISLIAACDIYEFNRNNEIETISSYCIPES